MEVKDGELVDGNGQLIGVESRGFHVEAQVNPEYVRRVLEFKGRRLLRTSTQEETDKEFRKLNEEVPVAAVAESDAQGLYNHVINGIHEVVTIDIDGTTYTGTVASGMTHTPVNANGCEEFDHVSEEGTTSPLYRVECCGGNRIELN